MGPRPIRFVPVAPSVGMPGRAIGAGIVDTTALLAELQRGRLRAALDVTDPEPLPTGHPLWHAPRTLISPHAGGNTTAFLPRAHRLIRDQLRRYLAGEPLENVVVSPT